MTGRPPRGTVVSIGPYELWMLAQGAMGFVGVGGMMFLIPLYVVEQGGSPSDAGAVMALAGALALTGPAIGGWADRFLAHRAMQLLSLGLLSAAALAFSFAREELTWLVAAALLGLGMAGLSVINATFVVGAGLPEKQQSGKLALLQLSTPSGQVLGLAAVAGLTAMSVDLSSLFLILAAVGALLTVVVAAVNGPAAARVGAPASRQDARPGSTGAVSLRALLFSPFGYTLAATALIVVAGQGLESQYPNYMQDTFAIDPTVSASALSVMVLVSIPLYYVVGRWTARSGPGLPLVISALMRAGAGVGLLLLPADSGGAALLVFALVMLAYPLLDLSSATLAGRTSPIGAGAGQGAVGAAMALGTLVAAVIAGWIAQQFGFPTLAWIAAVAGGIALVPAIAARRRTHRSAQ